MRGANEDLKHFSYAASHDLQEPLRMVTSYSQVEGAQRMETLLADLRE